MIVVADTSPLRYLILIEHTHVLPALFGHVIIPPAVVLELSRERTPPPVCAWLNARPDWKEIRVPQRALGATTGPLGPGEREAIVLAEDLGADALLIDDRDAPLEAKKRNLPRLGTLRVLADAAEHDFADLSVALARLRTTNFRVSDQLIQSLLIQHAKRREPGPTAR